MVRNIVFNAMSRGSRVIRCLFSKQARRRIRITLLSLLTLSAGCRSTSESDSQSNPSRATPISELPAPPHELYLPDQSSEGSVFDVQGPAKQEALDTSWHQEIGAPLPSPSSQRSCPVDMVHVAGLFCIDRYESSLVDEQRGRPLSPHFPPSQRRTLSLLQRWTQRAPRSGRAYGRSLPVPEPPLFQLTEKFSPQAQSVPGVLPAGYLNRNLAHAACKNAKKRLCRRGEWEQACRGQADTRFPYGDKYRDGVCNIHRKSHPARIIHGNASRHHLDPRLGLARDEDGPLLNPTGNFPNCVSHWGDDGVYDMVGNIDEWIEDANGAFLGGFYSRATRQGCEASIDSHSPGYLDYSLGTRCCSDPAF